MTDKDTALRGKTINVYESRFYKNLIVDIEKAALKAKINVSEYVRQACNEKVKREK